MVPRSVTSPISLPLARDGCLGAKIAEGFIDFEPKKREKKWVLGHQFYALPIDEEIEWMNAALEIFHPPFKEEICLGAKIAKGFIPFRKVPHHPNEFYSFQVPAKKESLKELIDELRALHRNNRINELFEAIIAPSSPPAIPLFLTI